MIKLFDKRNIHTLQVIQIPSFRIVSLLCSADYFITRTIFNDRTQYRSPKESAVNKIEKLMPLDLTYGEFLKTLHEEVLRMLYGDGFRGFPQDSGRRDPLTLHKDHIGHPEEITLESPSDATGRGGLAL